MPGGSEGICGILALDKPLGPTSHDVVASVRRALGIRRVGHAGTLDPLATGLLLVLVGPATRLSPYLSNLPKRYEALVRFGVQTSTGDSEGEVVSEMPVPTTTSDSNVARAILASMVGERQHVPPAYSAVKLDGTPAYRLARKGKAPTLEPRTIRVFGAELIEIVDDPHVTWRVSYEVSKGTYMRTLAEELGAMAGTVAHLSALRRTATGRVSIDQAIALQAFLEHPSDDAFIPWKEVLAMPIAVLDDESARQARNGRPLAIPSGLDIRDDDLVATSTGDGRLVGVHAAASGQLVARTILAGECA